MDMKRVEEIEKWYNRNLATNDDFEELLRITKQHQEQIALFKESLKEISETDWFTENGQGEIARKALENPHG